MIGTRDRKQGSEMVDLCEGVNEWTVAPQVSGPSGSGLRPSGPDPGSTGEGGMKLDVQTSTPPGEICIVFTGSRR